MVRLTVGLVVAIWVARYLGPKNYGILNYGIAYTAFFSLFVKLGLNKIIVREIVKHQEYRDLYLGTVFFMKLTGSAIAITLIALSLSFTESNQTVKITIFLISLGFIFQSLDIIDFYFQANLLSKYVVIARTISFVSTSLLKIIFIIYNLEVFYFAFAFSLELLLGSILLLLAYKLTGHNPFRWQFDRKIAFHFLRDSWPLAINIFLVAIHIRIDQAMIKSFLDLEQLGVFSVAVKIADYWYFIPAIIIQTLMPYFVKLRETNYQFYEYRLIQLYSMMFWMGTFVGIVTVIFGEGFINILFGSNYIGAYQVLVYSIWKGIFLSQALARGIWIISENVQFYRLAVNLLAVMTNVILNCYLIPAMGIAGAGLSSLLSIGLSTWIYGLFIDPLKYSTISMIKSISPFYLFRRNREFVL
jgi:O-antigen/teichoic acid export membrane protein